MAGGVRRALAALPVALLAAVSPPAAGCAAPAHATPGPTPGPTAGVSPGGSASPAPAPAPGAISPSSGVSLSPTPTPTPAPSAQDLAFLQQAHLDNLAEIQIGTAAEHRATSQAARNLGARLVREHTSLDADLQRIATRLGVSMPTSATSERRRQIAQVSARTGVAFDQAWVATVTAWNNQAVVTAQTEMRSGSLTDVTDLARDALTVARGHLSRLEKVPTDAPAMPTPVRTNVEDYSATQSPLVVSVAVVMIVLGVILLALTVRAALSSRASR
jgi:putative membrane protein